MALPSFICVGAQKAGTTWLYETLAQNPSVWLPPLKEVHYFDQISAGEKLKDAKRKKVLKLAARAEKKGKSKGSKGDSKVAFLKSLAADDVLSEAWYRRIFSHPESEGRISGEITPAYLVLKDERIDYVKSLLPDAKILIMVREPRARNISEIRMSAARSKRPELSKDEWTTILDGIAKRSRGNYKQAIPRWQKHYGQDQLLILPFGQLKTDPSGLVRTIESFIGARNFDGYKALNKSVHKTKEIELPDWVVEKATALAEPQKQYLINTFGQEFYERTK